MRFTDYYAILERDHLIQNPLTPEKLARLAEYCRPRPEARVLDVGCGKAWLLIEWARRFSVRGVGLEVNPTFLAAAEEGARRAGIEDRLRFVLGPALDFTPEPGGYDIALCVGASFALNTFGEAVGWLRRALVPGGVLAIGEPFLRSPPTPELLKECGVDALPYRDLPGTVAVIEAQGLMLSGLIASSADDWDHYESLQWGAGLRWARENPNHPERKALLSRLEQERATYLRLDRAHLGWALFVATPSTP
jgi:SAM-dependent methyltransferase